MSEAAVITRDARQIWARPGSAHDRLIKLLGVILPSSIGALAAVLVIAPLSKRSEISFVLNKDKVDMATERMRVSQAMYRGQDSKGRPFSLNARGAVQKSSRVPVVEMNDLSARIALDDGPAMLRAPVASYNMDTDKVRVNGPLLVQSSDGYRLSTRDVDVDLKRRTMASDTPVQGRMPIGTFSGNRMRADLESRTVTLDGRVRLHIVQGAVRAR